MRTVHDATIRDAAGHHRSRSSADAAHRRPLTRLLVRSALIALISAIGLLAAATTTFAADQPPERAEGPQSATQSTPDDDGLTDHAHVRFRLEGCRDPVDDPTYDPDAGVLVCDDSSYTPGNLGKQWNELDLVPHRLTTHLGTQRDATTSYSIAIAADHLLDRRAAFGYDRISVPVVDTDLSDPGCAIDAGPLESASDIVGGIDVTVYRVVTITQERGSTCAFDWHQRLAGPLQASRYPGSRLHSQVLDHDLRQIGQRTVPIPVREIEAAALDQTLSAAAHLAVDWMVDKSADPAAIHFAEACPPVDGALTADVDVIVSWTRSEERTEAITLHTEVRATNPSLRAVEMRVTATLIGEDATGDEVTIATATTDDPTWVSVPAETTGTAILTHEVTLDPRALGIDPGRGVTGSATAQVRDPIVGDELAELTASADASVTPADSGPQHGTVTITDREWIDGEGVRFSVEQVDLDLPTEAHGSATFADGYELGDTVARGDEVAWTLADVTEPGSVTFTKRVHLDHGTLLEPDGAGLSDVATVLGDGDVELDSVGLEVAVTSDATGTLTVEKTVPADALGAGESATFVFDVSGPDGFEDVVEITINGGAGNDGTYTGATEIAGVALGSYTVTERPIEGWSTVGDAEVEVAIDAPSCAATAAFANEPDVDVVVTEPAIQLIKLPDVPVAEVGDTVTYTFIVSNLGDLTLLDITLLDDVLGEIELPVTTLAPGESMVGTATYVVTEADLEAGAVTNVAVVEAVDDEGRRVTDEDDAVVTVFEEEILPAVEIEPDEEVVEELPVTGADPWRLLLLALLSVALGTALLVRTPVRPAAGTASLTVRGGATRRPHRPHRRC